MRKFTMFAIMAIVTLASTLAQAATWTVPTELTATDIQTSVMTVVGPALAVLIPLTLGFLVVALIVRAVKRGTAKTAR